MREELASDCRHALRRLGRDWRFTAAAVLILGLGTGANTAVFSLVNAVLFRHAPLHAPDRLVDLYQRAANPGAQDFSSYPAYLDMAARTDVFAGATTASIPRGVSYQHAGELRRAVVEHTTATYLSVLGLHVSLGRWFEAAEDADGAPVVAVVGHQTWTTRFGADPTLVGRAIRIDGVPVTVVGVGPKGHNGTLDVGLVTDFWLPVASLHALGMGSALERRPNESVFSVRARLRDGVTLAQAQAAMDLLGRRLAADYPREDPGRGIRVVASQDVWVHPQLDHAVTATASIVLALAGLVLAIACSNLATLLLVRGTARAKDVGVRLAMGATRRQLVRQLLTESLLLSGIGVAAGCALAWYGIRWLRTVELPFAIDLALDARVLAFAAGVAVLTGLACGLAPALHATKIDVLPTLRGERAGQPAGRRRLTLRNVLVVAQVSLSVLLLGLASLFLQWADAERARPPGHAVDGIAMLETDGRFTGYSAARLRSLHDELLRRTAAIPGVEAAALTRGLPIGMASQRLFLEGTGSGPESVVAALMVSAGPGYLETLRIPLLLGRTFDARDRTSTSMLAALLLRAAYAPAPGVSLYRPSVDPPALLALAGLVAVVGAAAAFVPARRAARTDPLAALRHD
jgi:predicted permease